MTKGIMCAMVSVFVATAFFIIPPVFSAEEASSMMCDEGVVNIGDADVDVMDKCGQPDNQSLEEWVYEFGPSQPAYSLFFKDGKVVRILEAAPSD